VPRLPVLRILSITAVIATLAFAIHGCKSDKNPVAPPGGGGGADVTINIVSMTGPNFFSPSPTTVTVGQKVAWKNTDTITHTATAIGGEFDTGNLAPGATSAAITMGTAGTFPYHCTIHTGMTGSLTVNP
jgi:plastocyanin